MTKTPARFPNGSIGLIAVLALAYFLAGKLGLVLAVEHPNITAAWMPSGIALAFLLVRGAKIWPGVLVGAFAINASTGAGWETASMIAIGNTR